MVYETFKFDGKYSELYIKTTDLAQNIKYGVKIGSADIPSYLFFPDYKCYWGWHKIIFWSKYWEISFWCKIFRFTHDQDNKFIPS